MADGTGDGDIVTPLSIGGQLGRMCRKCGQWKLWSEFYRHTADPTGYWMYCKLCDKERRQDRIKAKRAEDGPVPRLTAAPNTRQKLEREQERARIKQADERSRRAAMLNCPPGSVNLPLVHRLQKISDLLEDIALIDPADAVTMIPILRCREFSGVQGTWLSRVFSLCEQRVKEELEGKENAS